MQREWEKGNSAGAISSSADVREEEPWWLMGTQRKYQNRNREASEQLNLQQQFSLWTVKWFCNSSSSLTFNIQKIVFSAYLRTSFMLTAFNFKSISRYKCIITPQSAISFLPVLHQEDNLWQSLMLNYVAFLSAWSDVGEWTIIILKGLKL